MIVLDTSALLFWTLDPLKLSPVARREIDATERLMISSISVWEIALKVGQAKLEIKPTIEEYVAGLIRLDRLAIEPVDVATWLASVALDWQHRDPADRVIVGTAMLHDCPLVTSDRTIAEFYTHTVW